jgi:hypothetical protein
MTGVVPYLELASPAPVAVAIDRMGLEWANIAVASAAGGQLNLISFLIKVGAITGLSSVMLVLCYGQTRIFYTMARDGLLPAPDGTGVLRRVGYFPRQMDMVYASARSTQDMIQVCIPITADHSRQDIEARLAGLGNPARPDIASRYLLSCW